MILIVFQSIIDYLIDQFVPIEMFSRRKVQWFIPVLKILVRTKQGKHKKNKNSTNNWSLC